ncbi:MAG: hypothetical protein GF409_00015 [Candidatus Omnitrophica bacterium]|nr:hypothetical protein [Candidatus Omnitrophota bacterium]
MKNILFRIIIGLPVFAGLWFIVSILGLMVLIAFMFFTRNNPAFDLEMGWMVFMLLVPVAAVIVSVPVAVRLSRKISNKLFKKGALIEK